MLLLCDEHFYFVMKFETDMWYNDVSAKMASEYDQEIPISQTAD